MYSPQDTVKDLSLARSSSRGTSLITLYVPAGISLDLVSGTLNYEMSTSQNIKSKQVRSDVQSALRSGLQKIKMLPGHKAPENGFVLCAGHFDIPSTSSTELKSCV
ncbi:MAG: hypothetical protein Terrestrivirus4_17 [Terrestrivirus sp.]|uniref:eRF1/Pelota-like N-terminal domain-containing protein n=1 Tax=Terrestrivirus sp. TaxID=2487775 RepID=A0A3G4ZRB6_9VIRU|nr:MAG: hypothetical protein Terrestrivirus4_17 [Terrestrivirus sp.]